MTEKTEKRYQLKSLANLRPSPTNPRTITKEAFDGLKYSVESFGDISGITWNERSGNLVCGHQRVKALTEAGAELKAYGDRSFLELPDNTRFPVRVVDWDEDKEAAANLAANNQAIAGRWTHDAHDLIARVRERSQEDYERLQLANILKVAPRPPIPTDDDEVPEPPKDPVTKLGDVWRLGRHRVICGDAANNEAAFDHVITDPPYDAEAHTLQRRIKRGPNRGVTGIDGREPNDAPLSFEPLSFEPLSEGQRKDYGRVIANSTKRWALVFCQVESTQLWRAALKPMSYRRTAIWVKPDAMPQLSGDRPGMGYESIVCCHAQGRSRWNGGGRVGVFTHNKNTGTSGHHHQTQKPIPLMAELIELFTDAGESILDPFLGSGTTLIAAEQLDRVCYGIEIEPKYVDVVIERWENLTGQKAKRVTSD